MAGEKETTKRPEKVSNEKKKKDVGNQESERLGTCIIEIYVGVCSSS